MRISFFCSILLAIALSVFAEEQPVAPEPTPPPQLTAPAITAPEPSVSTAAKPEAAPLPATPQTDSTQTAPEPKEASTETTGHSPITVAPEIQIVPSAATVEPAKKSNGTKTAQRGRNASSKKLVGLLNNVPPLLAPALAEPAQPPFPWAALLLKQHPVRQIVITPPLLAGIRSTFHTGMDGLEEQEPQIKMQSYLTRKLTQQENGAEKAVESLDMLSSLVELQKTIKQQITITTKKLKASTSEAEKQNLQEELTKLDKQLSETGADFERIATGVESDVFAEKKQETFSWKEELASLLEPSIKQLKQLTARARLKTQLKETIADYNQQAATAHQAVENLNKLIAESKNPKIKTYLGELLPAWLHVEKRIRNKLDLTQLELAKLENKDTSLIKNSGSSIREFFRTRGLYLLIAFLAFVAILLAFKLLSRLILYVLPGSKKEQRPIHVRILDIFFQVFSVASAICGLIFVLFSAEDWFLLSMTIIIFLGLLWTVRQALPKMWQQVRLVLNMGSIREGERIIYNGVPWNVESLNVFCKLYNPALAMHVRIPIEDMIGLISRPYQLDEPWFPCKKGDWVAIEGKPFAKVASLSLEQVEVVELGGRRTVYQTGDFLGKSPANLSRNFSIRVPFGLSYDLQAEITTSVPETLKAFLQKQLEENGYGEACLSLNVDFLQAGASSLDLVVLADFKGEEAAAYRRLERALAKWCVDCCNANKWDIPFPQMTVHLPSENRC
jgi:hypothetical protein